MMALATEPPEARGTCRDEVRLMVARRSAQRLEHHRFADLPDLLSERDLLVVNTSGTLAAAVYGHGPGSHVPLVVHFSTQLAAPPGPERWVIEPRLPLGGASTRWPKGQGHGPPPSRLCLPGGATARLEHRYRDSPRLWVAELDVPGHQSVMGWLGQHGRPIRYQYVPREWGLAYYQTVFASEPGSAEMPSAARPFSAATVVRLVARGVGIAPVVLHTGVSSLEPGEKPYPERARVPAGTARRINATREGGGRVVAVGTTVVRALESAYDSRLGAVWDFEGWADVVVTPATGAPSVDGLLTGWHEPEASHLLMLEAVAGRELLARAYVAAESEGYLGHEFGDVALFLP